MKPLLYTLLLALALAACDSAESPSEPDVVSEIPTSINENTARFSVDGISYSSAMPSQHVRGVVYIRDGARRLQVHAINTSRSENLKRLVSIDINLDATDLSGPGTYSGVKPSAVVLDQDADLRFYEYPACTTCLLNQPFYAQAWTLDIEEWTDTGMVADFSFEAKRHNCDQPECRTRAVSGSFKIFFY